MFSSIPTLLRGKGATQKMALGKVDTVKKKKKKKSIIYFLIRK